ncbi:hypothetical protein KJ855_03165 [Patescibacteria group bacterium]|nr:hypothetical protein [Patescibacteria group bacterium]
MNQPIDNNQLADLIKQSHHQLDGKIGQLDDKIDQLARATADGFKDVYTKIDRNYQEIVKIKQDMDDYQVSKSNHVSRFEHNRLAEEVTALKNK